MLFDAVPSVSPPWLSTGVAQLYLGNLALGADALLSKLNQAMLAHMPGLGTTTALTYIGNDRVLPQGPNETNAQYIQRLTEAFDTWDHAGATQGVLGQTYWYFYNPSITYSSVLPTMEIIAGNKSYTKFDYLTTVSNPALPPNHQQVSPGNFNWDNLFYPWRAWLVLFSQPKNDVQSGSAASLTTITDGFQTVTGLSGMTANCVGEYLVVTGAASSANNSAFQIASYLSPTSVVIANSQGVANDANNGSISWTVQYFPAIAPAPVIGSPGMVFGANATASMSGLYHNALISIGLLTANNTFTALRPLVRLWKSATTFYPWFIISFGGDSGLAGSEFSPNSSEGSGNPDGTWGHWGKLSNGKWVAARNTGSGNYHNFVSFVDGTGIYQNSYVFVLD